MRCLFVVSRIFMCPTLNCWFGHLYLQFCVQIKLNDACVVPYTFSLIVINRYQKCVPVLQECWSRRKKKGGSRKDRGWYFNMMPSITIVVIIAIIIWLKELFLVAFEIITPSWAGLVAGIVRHLKSSPKTICVCLTAREPLSLLK